MPPRFYSSISALLIVTTLSMSGSALFLPKQAEAENAIATGFGSALLGCANANGAITEGLTSLFDGVMSSFNFSIEGADSPTVSTANDPTGNQSLEAAYGQASDNDNAYEEYEAIANENNLSDSTSKPDRKSVV